MTTQLLDVTEPWQILAFVGNRADEENEGRPETHGHDNHDNKYFDHLQDCGVEADAFSHHVSVHSREILEYTGDPEQCGEAQNVLVGRSTQQNGRNPPQGKAGDNI